MTAPPADLPEASLETGTVVLCDLHLDVGAERPSDAFEAVLAALEGAPRLVLLGDLFDYWVGPVQLTLAGAPRILDALAALARGGTAIDVLVGNRDFLLDRSFEERTGATLRPRGLVGVHADGARSLLIHGDELCTLDRGYQRLRRVLRSRLVRGLGPRLPLAVSQRIARRLRRASTAALELKPSEEKSMQRDACEAWASATRADHVLCGHAHAFRDERLAGGARWLVLDAFGGARDLARLGPGGWQVGASAALAEAAT